jgi:hypothetical protein
MHLGKWVTGRTGTKRICSLVDELDHKHAKHISSLLRIEYDNYQPWMSCTNQIEYFSKTWPITQNQILIEPCALSVIANGLKKDEAPLGNLGMPETDGFEIDLYPNIDFQNNIDKALQLIFAASTNLQNRWEKLIQLIVPIKHRTATPTTIGRGLSNHMFRKSIFVELPCDSPKKDLQTALNLVHELGHQALITYQNADLIVESNHDYPVHSVIRNTKRPIIRSYHAFFVSGYMLEFLIEAQKLKLPEHLNSQIKEELVKHRKIIFLATSELKNAPVKFTQLGIDIINEFESLATAEAIQ